MAAYDEPWYGSQEPSDQGVSETDDKGTLNISPDNNNVKYTSPYVSIQLHDLSPRSAMKARVTVQVNGAGEASSGPINDILIEDLGINPDLLSKLSCDYNEAVMSGSSVKETASKLVTAIEDAVLSL